MGFYGDQVLPRLTDKVLGVGHVHKLRARACAGLFGDVVEVGFGSGLNVEHYPADVRTIAAVEPNDAAWKLARPRIEQGSVDVRRAGLDGQRLDLTVESMDAALSTFTMCTIPDAAAALAEIWRVLKPGGVLHFVEHGLAPDKRIVAWQRRLNPVHGLVAGGCHLDRPIADLIVGAGLAMDDVDTFYDRGPRPFNSMYIGRATKRWP